MHLASQEFIPLNTRSDDERQLLSELTDCKRRDGILAASNNTTASTVHEALAVFARWKGGNKFIEKHSDPLLQALAEQKLIIALGATLFVTATALRSRPLTLFPHDCYLSRNPRRRPKVSIAALAAKQIDRHCCDPV